MTVEQEIDILIQYGEADMSERLDLFLQFPGLRRGFQKIEQKHPSVRTRSTSSRGEYKGKYSNNHSIEREISICIPENDVNV